MKFLLLSLLLFAAPAWAATIRYVDGSLVSDCAGNYSIVNRNCTGSDGTAYNTIAEGRTNTASGDTLRIRPGTYVELLNSIAGPHFANGLSESQRTVIEGCSLAVCGDTPLSAIIRPSLAQLQGQSGEAPLAFQQRSYITVKNLTIDQINEPASLGDPGAPQNIRLGDSSHHIRIESNWITNCRGSCIQAATHQTTDRHHFEIVNNTIGPNLSVDIGDHGIYLRARDNLVERNYIYTGPGYGIRFDRPTWGAVANNIIRYNYVTGYAAGLNTGGGPDGQAHNNIIDSNRTVIVGSTTSSGIRVANGSPTNWQIYNNTIYNSQGICIHIDANTHIIKNNLCLSNTDNRILDTPGGSTITNNVLSTTNSILIDVANALFSPSTSGAATLVNQGVNVGLPFNGSAPNVGAMDSARCSSAEVGLVNATTTVITCTNNLGPPLLPATACTGFTRQEENPASTWNTLTVSSCTRQATNQIVLVHATATTGRAQRFSYTPGNVTDSLLIGGSLNSELLAISNQSVTNNVGAGAPTWVLTQSDYLIYRVPFRKRSIGRITMKKLTTAILSLILSASLAFAAPNTKAYVIIGGSIIVAVQVNCTGADCPAFGGKFQYDIALSDSWVDVPATMGAGNIIASGLSSFSGASYPGQLYQMTGCIDATGLTATNIGALARTPDAVPNADLAQNECMTAAIMLSFDTDVTPGTLYRIRMVQQDGTVFAGAYVHAQIEIMQYQGNLQ